MRINTEYNNHKSNVNFGAKILATDATLEAFKYAKELLVFISQNGTFKRQDLLREELDFDDIFDSVQINKLLALIEERV